MKTLFIFFLLFLVLFIGFALLAFLASKMDITYSGPQTSGSIAESRQNGAFVQRLEPENKQVEVAGLIVKIKEVWIEREWIYKENELIDWIRGQHPTVILTGKSLLIRLEGDSLPKSYLRDWAFTLKKGPTGSVNKTVSIFIENEADPIKKV